MSPPDQLLGESAGAQREGGAASALDAAACRRLMRGGSRSFYAASLLLPAQLRAPASALYAFCRLADDAVDDAPSPAAALAALAALRHRLERIYAGAPVAQEADQALARVVDAHDIPLALPAAMLEGFAWDAEGRRYATLEALHDYAARVAGTVGAMMALVMGSRSAAVLARACELGVAMQLTNIARDVGEDARAGRLYLPMAWLQQEGIDAQAWLAQPVHSAALGRVVARLLQAADALYERAALGVAALPRNCRPAIDAARRIYREIGRQVAAHQHDAVSRRAVVPARRKLALATQALGATLVPLAASTAPTPLAAIEFLVAAVPWTPPPPAAPHGVYQRTVRIIELLERVAERNRQAQTQLTHARADAARLAYRRTAATQA